MNKAFRLTAAALALAALAACAQQEQGAADAAAPASLDTDAQKFGYAIGVDLGKSLQPVKGDVDIAALKAGLDDAFAGTTPKLDDAAREEIKNSVARKMQERQQAERAEQAAKAQQEGEAFLAENAKREGVKTTESGLQYEVLTEGKGEKPTAEDRVTVHYKGTLINGEEFDSSYARGQPVTFPLSNVIPGWTEGVQLMTPGSKYKFVIPSKLAYGERGAGVKIGPNETLVFEVELISIEKDEAKK
ncbi:FKBP-type peptidyl-prolyl cis-trans isomerase [Sinimarinibacterium flocculans]|uniref:Peptidyl-prolyl cis-trans isomerase n=1 Tax=Sinimarinibacterium flocculans TaxID=985250 RepID=A0A318E2Y9_9GAMM|nr:FKBP-type peptidyl-prolyl cis-trans isomerase [Sinimarinibacterium flocculans]PXV65257.1 FKBP-type peptidyl-prolyl cis-trans isomerase FkpA/FKBP-type peptidyl-prolyl cis-trans isomerase FklB [Sinimarinibacterium flocculans]